eukprot:jgi/Galph1/5096/GphlegSOOS_G3686.1
MSAFEELGVLPEIIQAVEEMDWLLPKPVQAESIPQILGGGDVAVSAETGSGKTGAFCLPLVQICYETLEGRFLELQGKSKKIDTSLAIWGKRDYNLQVNEETNELENKLSNRWQGIRACRGVNSGCWGFHVKVLSEGLCRVGWSTARASLDLGTDSYGFGYGSTGRKSHRKEFSSYGESYGINDVVSCYIDFSSSQIFFSKNGKKFETAFRISADLVGQAFYPAVCLKNCRVKVYWNTDSVPSLVSGYKPVIEAPSIREESSSKKMIGSNESGPLAVILEPSRELAIQVVDEIAKFAKYLKPPIRVATLVGGEKVSKNIKDLQKGVEIICGTLGRVEECLEGGHLNLSQVRFLVLDEADAFVNQNQTPSILNLHRQIEENSLVGGVQVLFFSATLHSPGVLELSERIQQSPTIVDMKGKDYIPEAVQHSVFYVKPTEIDSWNIDSTTPTDGMHETSAKLSLEQSNSQKIKQMKPFFVKRLIDSFSMEQGIIFVRTQLDADNLQEYFRSLSRKRKHNYGSDDLYSSVVLHGGISGRERKANIQSFKGGEVRFLICTDVASRGLDIEGLPYLINVTLPDNVETYIHRVGRVGRAERLGLAVSLVSTVPEQVWFHTCPSRGRNNQCRNRKLVSEGGCTIWYNEMEILQAIQQKLPIEIIFFDRDFKRPKELERKFGYKEQEAEEISMFEKRQEHLKPITETLRGLELQVQRSFLNLSHRFSQQS